MHEAGGSRPTGFGAVVGLRRGSRPTAFGGRLRLRRRLRVRIYFLFLAFQTQNFPAYASTPCAGSKCALWRHFLQSQFFSTKIALLGFCGWYRLPEKLEPPSVTIWRRLSWTDIHTDIHTYKRDKPNYSMILLRSFNVIFQCFTRASTSRNFVRSKMTVPMV